MSIGAQIFVNEKADNIEMIQTLETNHSIRLKEKDLLTFKPYLSLSKSKVFEKRLDLDNLSDDKLVMEWLCKR